MNQSEKRFRHKKLGQWFYKTFVNKDNSEHTGTQGGFLVPSELRIGIDEVIEEESFFHSFGTVLPMNSVEVNVPYADPAAAAAGGSPLLGGMSLSWLSGDSIAPAESEVSLAQCKLVTRELGGYCLVSRQLVEDGGETLGAYLEILLGKTVAFYIQKAGFNGTGTGGQPLGIINSPGSAVVNRSTPSSFVAADGDAMLAKLLPASMKHAWWCVSPSAFGKMSGLTSFYPAVVANENGLRVEASGMFRGLPVFVSETLPDLGTKGDVCLVDPRACLVGERRETEVSWSKEAAINGLPTAYIANQSIIRTWWRGGLEPLWQKTATLANGVTGVSPIVVLN